MSEILIYIVLILLLSFLVFNNLDNFENQVIPQYCVMYNQMCLNKNNPTYNEEWCNEYVNRCSPPIISEVKQKAKAKAKAKAKVILKQHKNKK